MPGHLVGTGHWAGVGFRAMVFMCVTEGRKGWR